MSDDRIKDIQESLEFVRNMQKSLSEKGLEGKISDASFPQISIGLQYQSMQVNLETQEQIMHTLKEAESLNRTAYTVAVISVGISTISIILGIFF